MKIIQIENKNRDKNIQFIIVDKNDKYGVAMIAYFKNSFNGAKYCYIAEVKTRRLYDINKDILKLTGSGKDIFAEVKKRGYIGLIGSNGFSCVVLFKSIKIKGRKDLTKGF